MADHVIPDEHLSTVVFIHILGVQTIADVDGSDPQIKIFQLVNSCEEQSEQKRKILQLHVWADTWVDHLKLLAEDPRSMFLIERHSEGILVTFSQGFNFVIFLT